MPVHLPPAGKRASKMPHAAVAILGVMPGLYRLVNGRGMGPSLVLTTVGGKSGLKRDAHLTSFPVEHGDGWLVVASKGGSPTHPAWYFNMASHPEKIWVQVGSRRGRVTAETLRGDDRARAWQRITSKFPNYSGYEKKTDREIHVVRLT